MRGSLHESSVNLEAWKKRAERLRALAKVTRDERQRAELLDLARQWDGMVAQAALHRRRQMEFAD
jgi:hypothetical protein